MSDDSTSVSNSTTSSTIFRELPASAAARPLSQLHNLELNVAIEIGRVRMKLEDVLKIGRGVIVELDKLAGDPVDVLVNDRVVARGEVVVVNDKFAVRINEIVAAVPGTQE